MPLPAVLAFLGHVLRRHLRLLLGLVFGFLAPWLLFLEIAEEIWEGNGFPGDQSILQFLHAHASPTMDAVALWFARAGGPWATLVLEGLIILGLLLVRQYRALGFFALAVGGAGLLNLFAKYILSRARPALWVSLSPETSYSFPSGHSMAAAALAATLGVMLWRTRFRRPALVLGTLWALGMGWSRVYLGVHFPSDVLAGWVGSLGWVGGLHLLFARYFMQLRHVWGEARLYWNGRAAARLAREAPPAVASGRKCGQERLPIPVRFWA
ncbi:phosphatase PAP2 family protein [Hymenobacter rubidus]|uniref:phosphatase PAP2 family protein n=1 Tax=Hymenobacter rubidus TaxID=1441626 RepID=UPI00191E349E|nr:phosphatase PAP2 family protein [Hymenobacter rubidus]